MGYLCTLSIGVGIYTELVSLWRLWPSGLWREVDEKNMKYYLKRVVECFSWDSITDKCIEVVASCVTASMTYWALVSPCIDSTAPASVDSALHCSAQYTYSLSLTQILYVTTIYIGVYGKTANICTNFRAKIWIINFSILKTAISLSDRHRDSIRVQPSSANRVTVARLPCTAFTR